jgi:hypothetical protein
MSCGCGASNATDLSCNPVAGAPSATSPGGPPAALIDGFSHMIFTVACWDQSKRFYHRMCSHLGLTCVLDTEDWLYYVGGELPSICQLFNLVRVRELTTTQAAPRSAYAPAALKTPAGALTKVEPACTMLACECEAGRQWRTCTGTRQVFYFNLSI